MSALCKDCGMDTEPWPPRRGTQEQFIVKDEVWAAAGMPPGKMEEDLSLRGGGFLCVGCIEKRLGRLLKVDDFAPIALKVVKDCHSTPRLLSRLGIAFMAMSNNPLPEHIVEQWTASTIRNVLKHEPAGKGLVKVDVDGDEVILVYKREAVSYRAGPKLQAFMASLRRDRFPEEDVTFDLLAWEDEAA